MYIKSARITNIRSIEDFEINFEEPAGWHVLIGDNGSGKSTIIRSLALALVGPDEAPGLRADWRDWLSNKREKGKIELEIKASEIDEKPSSSVIQKNNFIPNILIFERNKNDVVAFSSNEDEQDFYINPKKNNWGDCKGWFSAAYGPYRRFSGGNQDWSKVYSNQPKLGAHLSAFGEDVALTEPIEWLIKLNYQEVEKIFERLEKFQATQLDKMTILDVQYIDLTHRNSGNSKEDLRQDLDFFKIPSENSGDSIIDNLKKLINSHDFLPNNTTLEKISSKGVFFKDGNENIITINQLSDGYRSILSLTLELVRQLIKNFDEEAVFKNIREDKMYIDLPGVVLIDEIDAHLHPTWQTKIGQWFLKYFPNLQFIVTTHSPLVCRAAEKGTIWKLAAPGINEKSAQVTGIDRDRLIYGNVLDAYGTEEFGIVDNTKAVDKKEELVRLSKKQTAGKISKEEESKLHQLRAIFSTDATIEL